ncbi:MAG: hypothetical protein HY847_07395 [Betaproteobacteria bacterium]|nr:hypothetical protein [Betaproteobacteria bacterium]
MLHLFAANAVVMMAIALGLWLFAALPSVIVAHLVLALGIMPLILAAMAYFVPVLTRSDAAPRSVMGLALLAWLGGLTLVISFAVRMEEMSIAIAVVGTLLAAKAAASLLFWTVLRSRHGLGSSHPGLAWYIAALGFLLAALFSVPLFWLWPEQHAALRLMHLHANLLGFVGLTAIGTLQVLLPTAAGRWDKHAATRLKQDLGLGIGGAALVALGAGFNVLLAYLGAILFFVPLLRMGTRWSMSYADHVGRLHGASTALGMACFGLTGLIFAGIGHALGFLNGGNALVGFVPAFLLPLVSGAAIQLLPVWLRPGRQDAWHEQLRHVLGRYTGMHAPLFVAGGLMAAFGYANGLWLAVPALGILLINVALSLPLLRAASTTA